MNWSKRNNCLHQLSTDLLAKVRFKEPYGAYTLNCHLCNGEYGFRAKVKLSIGVLYVIHLHYPTTTETGTNDKDIFACLLLTKVNSRNRRNRKFVSGSVHLSHMHPCHMQNVRKLASLVGRKADEGEKHWTAGGTWSERREERGRERVTIALCWASSCQSARPEIVPH